MREKYRFMLGDLRAFIQVINVMLIMKYGLIVAWFGLAVAGLGLIIDIFNYFNKNCHFRVNSVIMHTANIVLNIYFMCC